MTQGDLFAPPAPKPRCGTCVTFCRVAGMKQLGSCARLGARRASDPPCPEYFPTDELNRPLYGRKPDSRDKRRSSKGGKSQ